MARGHHGSHAFQGEERSLLAHLWTWSCWLLLRLCSWVHAHTARPLVDWWDDSVLAVWEESAKLVVREGFVTTHRVINGTSAWVLTFFDADYRRSLQQAWQQQQDWQSWWKEERQSTLNVVIARCGTPDSAANPSANGDSRLRSFPVPSQPAATSGAGTPAASSSRRWWQWGRPAQQAAAHAPPPGSLAAPPQRHKQQGSARITGGLRQQQQQVLQLPSKVQPSSSQPNGSSSFSHQQALRLRRMCSDCTSNSNSLCARPGLLRPCSTCTNLAAAHTTSTSAGWSAAAGVGDAAGSFRQQQQQQQPVGWVSRLWGGRSKGRGSGRQRQLPRANSAIFELPSAWGAHESLKRRGLLEDCRLVCELLVTAGFDAVRAVVRTMLWVPKRSKRTTPGRQARLAAKGGKVAAGGAGSPPPRAAAPGRRRSKVQMVTPPAVELQRSSSPFAADATQHLFGDAAAVADAESVRRMAAAGKEPGVQLGRGDVLAGTGSSGHSSGSEGSSSGELSRGRGRLRRLHVRSKSVGGDLADLQRGPSAAPVPRLTLRRVRSVSRWDHGVSMSAPASPTATSAAADSAGGASRVWLEDGLEDEELSPAARVIHMAGYPLELHTVTTEDGYLLQMERIPRLGAKKVAFFMHGILDTSLTWVSSGVTGSQAFAAWDRGLDVWLGTSRNNPPRACLDPKRQGAGYWTYSLNELGVFDMSAQLDHIHEVKCREMAAAGDPGFTPRHALDLLLPSRSRCSGEAAFGRGADACSSSGDGLPGWVQQAAGSTQQQEPEEEEGEGVPALQAMQQQEVLVGAAGSSRSVGGRMHRICSDSQLLRLNSVGAHHPLTLLQQLGQKQRQPGPPQEEQQQEIKQQQQLQRQQHDGQEAVQQSDADVAVKDQQSPPGGEQQQHQSPFLHHQQLRPELDQPGWPTRCVSAPAAGLYSPDSHSTPTTSSSSRAAVGSTQQGQHRGQHLHRLRLPTHQQQPPPLQQQQQGAQQPPGHPKEPYDLQVVAHSLGGASILIFVLMRCLAGAPHHIQRLVLMSPAGFHQNFPLGFLWPLVIFARTGYVVLRWLMGPSAGMALYIPTLPARLLAFKLASDAARMPAFARLINAGMSMVLGGDRSAWDRAVAMPHYSAKDMPAISLQQGLHLVQLIFKDRFQLYDYGSAAANRRHYSRATPPDLGNEYWRLDIPVDIIGGSCDGVIPPADVRRHVQLMAAQGVKVTYREFDYGHLDFTFTCRDELKYYVMQRLLSK